MIIDQLNEKRRQSQMWSEDRKSIYKSVVISERKEHTHNPVPSDVSQ